MMLRTWLAVLLLLSLLPVPSRAWEDAKPFVRVNQLGYRTDDPKVALAFSNGALPGRFKVVGVEDGRVVFEGEVRRASGGWGQFGSHAELDFTALRKAGRYVLRLDGGESASFEVGASWPGITARELNGAWRPARRTLTAWASPSSGARTTSSRRSPRSACSTRG